MQQLAHGVCGAYLAPIVRRAVRLAPAAVSNAIMTA
ncbi:hypothetical protein KGO5_01437 [Sinorhizobium sp. KGO-5]|nr:hypothetical protein KGO5_01437 [Sinorhizobium sp. KGO-5]